MRGLSYFDYLQSRQYDQRHQKRLGNAVRGGSSIITRIKPALQSGTVPYLAHVCAPVNLSKKQCCESPRFFPDPASEFLRNPDKKCIRWVTHLRKDLIFPVTS